MSVRTHRQDAKFVRNSLAPKVVRLKATERNRNNTREEMIQAREDLIADIRDACVGELHTSGLSDKQVHERHGPTPQTIKNWRLKKTRLPQLATARMMLRAVGKDIAIVDYVMIGR